jgi:hypothetical protein
MNFIWFGDIDAPNTYEFIQTLRAFRRTGTHVRRSACPWPGVPEEKAVSE